MSGPSGSALSYVKAKALSGRPKVVGGLTLDGITIRKCPYLDLRVLLLALTPSRL